MLITSFLAADKLIAVIAVLFCLFFANNTFMYVHITKVTDNIVYQSWIALNVIFKLTFLAIFLLIFKYYFKTFSAQIAIRKAWL